MSKTRVDQSRTDLVLGWLGYLGHPGWVTPGAVETVSGCRNVLRQAFDGMGVAGCFGIPQASRQDGVREFLPVVYVASAPDAHAARNLHRQVWSQGSVPFLVVVTPEGILSCDATWYETRDWEKRNTATRWNDGGTDPRDVIPRDMSSVEHLAAIRLNVSVALGGSRRERGPGRVDQSLLDGLRTLCAELTGDGPRGGLPVDVANRLLSCFLYLYCLADRGVVTQDWVTRRGHGDIVLDGRTRWSVAAFARLMGDLEAVFNGGVFSFPASATAHVREEHIATVRGVLKHGETINGDAIQTSLLDIDLSVLRTETLSSVYEMLFENQGVGAREADGAFYTPAYVADYVLAQVDAVRRIEPGTRVVDCAAGSGVFLVGAYRRMLERKLEATGRGHVALSVARNILSDDVFGIERNPDAANVAAFSLFLTMLDYAPGVDLGRADCCGTVFPPVIGRSILVRDLFDEAPLPDTFAGGFDVLLGNPPWQKVKVIGAKAERAMEKLLAERGHCMDRDRACELFFWTGYDRFLRPGGAYGVVMSAKSFISPGANAFPDAFLEGTRIGGFANLTHLRRKLFPAAEHPAIAVFGRRAPQSRTDPVWVHFPLMASLPLDASGTPWCLVRDATDVETHTKLDLAGKEGVFRTLMLRPADRRMVDYLDDACAVGRAVTLGDLCAKAGLYLGRGGSPTLTGLPSDKLLGTGSDNDWRIRLGLPVPGRTMSRKRGMLADGVTYTFDADDLARTGGPFASLFAGDVVVIPRSLAQVEYVERMFGFNSSLLGLCFPRDGSPLDASRIELLKGLGRFLGSGFARYAAALYGRMWMIDRRRFEVGDLMRLPVPLRGIGDERTSRLLEAADGEGLETEIKCQFGIEGPLADIADEYRTVRVAFENGLVPESSGNSPDDETVGNYATTLATELQRSVTDTWRVVVEDDFDADRRVHVVVARFRKVAGSVGPARETVAMGCRRTASSWFDTLGVTYDAASREVTVEKPDFAVRWTREQAVSDGRRILAHIQGAGTGA